MNLCLSIIQDEIPFEAHLIGDGTNLELSQYAFWKGDCRLRENTLYILTSDNLPEIKVSTDTSALLCIGEPTEPVLPKNLPVLIVNEKIDPMELSNAVGLIFERYNKLENKLNRAFRSGSLQELVETMTPFIKNEIIVADSNHLVLAHSYIEIQTLTLSGMAQESSGLLPPEIIAFFKGNRFWQEVKTYSEPFIYNEGLFRNRLLCANILNGKEFVCRVMIGETENTFRDYDKALLVYLAEYVKWLFESTVIVRHVESVNDLTDILLMQLSGINVEPWRLKHALRVKTYKEEARYQCLCVRLCEADYSTNTVQYYSTQLVRMFRGVTAFAYKGDLICLMNLDYYDSQQSLLTEITPFIRDNNFRAGISTVFDDIENFVNYHTQAELALDYGMSQIPSKWVHRFAECMMDCIVWKVSTGINVRALCDERILILYDYDNVNNSAYIKTVETYFNNHLNTLQTAKTLGIHRSTMIYRLERIAELSGITFDDSDNNLLFHFSIKLLKLIDAQQN